MQLRRDKDVFALFLVAVLTIAPLFTAFANEYNLKPTNDDLMWLLPDQTPAPDDNLTTPDRVALGKALFFDPRVSIEGNVSCASCHIPQFGWSDGLKTSKGINNKNLGRATPTIVNTGFNSIQYWDGRRPSLEKQASGPMLNSNMMAADMAALVIWLKNEPFYQTWFARTYRNEPLDQAIVKALAAFQRTIISNNSPFDQWLKGDQKAMTRQQIMGFRLFSDAKKANCVACHHAPNFTDNGFHNVGLASYDLPKSDMGRFAHMPVAVLRGAFKTPTLRDISLTAPYFHDGSARTLMDVVEHFDQGGKSQHDISSSIKALSLSLEEKQAIVAFLQALTTDHAPVALPNLPPPNPLNEQHVK